MKLTFELERSFPHEYEAEVLSELPGQSSRIYYFPGGNTKGGLDGFLVRVMPKVQQEWLGIFAFGRFSRKGLNGLFTCPNPFQICIVSLGNGFIVNVDDPNNHQQLPLFPVLHAFSLPHQNLIVFADFTRLVAYGPNGLVWKTPSLSWDELQVVEITSDSILGKSWDSPNDHYVDFKVDLQTGRYEGGSSPEIILNIKG